MKTKNNVQKTILRMVAVIVSFVLISFTVSAHDFWKRLLTNSSFNEIALAMVEAPTETNDAINSSAGNSLFYILNEVNDPALDLENWMTVEYYFGNTSIQIIEENDEQLELEDWMFNADLFGSGMEAELSLELEDWMTSNKYWKS